MTAEARYLRIISGQARGPAASAARAGLRMFSPLYGAAMALRNAGYDRGWRRREPLPRPVVSIGNLTVGGTGKTPMVAWLSRELAKSGHKPAVLMRGYKAPGGAKGDEQRLLEHLLGDTAVVEAGADRRHAAGRALERHPGISVFVLDDGFQHRRIQRAVDVVLIDATRPFGHGRLLPAGLLREPLSSLSRATAVILTRTDLVSNQAADDSRRVIALHTGAPILHCRFAPAGEPVAGRKVMGFCGIGNAGAFFEALRRQGAELTGELALPDHYHYRAADVQQIREAARRQGGVAVTTEKDWVKLEALWPAGEPIIVQQQQVVFAPGQDKRLLELVQERIR